MNNNGINIILFLVVVGAGVPYIVTRISIFITDKLELQWYWNFIMGAILLAMLSLVYAFFENVYGTGENDVEDDKNLLEHASQNSAKHLRKWDGFLKTKIGKFYLAWSEAFIFLSIWVYMALSLYSVIKDWGRGDY